MTTGKKLEMERSSITVHGPWWMVLSLLILTTAAADESAPTDSPIPPPIGEREKIRFFFSQWHHFKIGDDALMSNLQKVGATIFADWGCSDGRARAAHEHGIRYFCGFATAKLRGPAREHKTRLAVDKTGRTCPQRFDEYVKAGGDPNKPWASWGAGKGAYVPCPLDRRPWNTLLKPILDLARKGLADGLNIDQEPYSAYGFDKPGDMLCYCDDCFSRYLEHENLEARVARKDRYAWLEQKDRLDDYIKRLRSRLTGMFRLIADELRQARPDFTFSSYPGFPTNDLRNHWRMEAMALGFTDPQAPFIVVDSTPYWEDPQRRWWDSCHEAYRRMGLRHVMGSWDNGQMGGHAESHLGAADLMYELAMGADGFWRWGEHAFGTDDWRTFAMANQKLRRVEAKLGDFLFDGEDIDHFVTLVEQTGNPDLERAIVARTWRHGGRYLIRLFNGNTDWPIYLRVRMPRPAGEGPWRLRDAIHDVDFIRAAEPTWDRAALSHGVVLPMPGRGELFLLLEKAPDGFRPDRFRSVFTLEMNMHAPRADETAELPPAEGTAGPTTAVHTKQADGGYDMAHGYSKVTTLSLADVEKGNRGGIVHLPGFCREPRYAPDGRHLAASIYVNGRGQIYLVTSVSHRRRNISRNAFCDRSPRWTPDGKRIVFVSDRGGDWDIYSMALDGGDVRRLTDARGTDRSPAVSPDGKHIAFISDRGGDFDLFIMNADGGDQRRLNERSGNEYEPIWAPDGSWVGSTVRINNVRGIQIMDRQGRHLRHPTLGPATDLHSLRVSPDGTKIACAFTRYQKAGILLIDLQGAGSGEQTRKVRELVHRGASMLHNDGWYHTGTGSPRWIVKLFSGVSFSPDGRRILYCSNQDGGSFRLFTVSVDGGEPLNLSGTDTPLPVETDWSPR